uniref:Kinetochore associated 1 n=1 Tax=Sphenodon punctatus TaxID=8508 RepID=A0A8D0H519_SPHPU
MWNDIELLTNDDTGSGRLSIGSRQECGSALYQVDTLVKITSSEKVLINPKLYACNSSDGCLIVADRSVALLDSIFQSFKMYLQFDTEVDVVGLCQEGQFLVVGERSGSLHLIHVSSKQTLLTKVGDFISCVYHMFILTNNGFFCILYLPLAKTQEGRLMPVNVLSVWEVHSLTLIWDWPSVHIEEFLLTTESDSSSVARQGFTNLKVIALTKLDDNKQMRNIMVFSLPEMHRLYSLEVTDVSSLVQSGISTDTIYFLEGIYENHQKSPEAPVSVLVTRCLTEALPENRLSRLLHKQKFTEAENFAIQFGLDVELVYKVKASSVLEKLASASIGSYRQNVWLELVEEAKETMHKIQYNQFVVDYCIHAPWPTYETTQEMLNYAKARVSSDEISFLEIAQSRLTTFYGAFGPEKFSGISWTEFLNNEDIFKNILSQLEEGNLPCAQYLWLRHQADFENSFDVKMLENLLNIIPTTIPVKELCLWFKNVVIPFVRRVVPQGQKKIAKWLEQGARDLELTDKTNWPENGLKMAEVFFTSKNPGELGLASSWCWIPLKDRDCEEIHRLKKLVNDLHALVDLHRKYSCRLALCDFEKENAVTIVFRMFDKVLAPELIPSTLEKFIKPYIHQHNLQEDELLLQYIKDLLERCCTRSTSVFETAWEAKAIAVIGCMSDIDVSILQNKGVIHLALKVVYLLQPRPMDYSSRILFEIATSATSPIGVNQLTLVHRSRALKCLIYLSDTSTVEALFKKPIEKVKYFLKCLIYLAEFETLNIPYTYESFHNSPKEGMIKGLWKNHSHEPTAVRLVTELSLEYKVYDPQLWSGLLQKLLGFNMIQYLSKVLVAIAGIYSLWQVCDLFITSNRLYVLSNFPFIFSSSRCPVLADLDLIGIAKQYAQLDLPAFALGCLLLIPQSEKREQQIQGFLASCNPETVLQQADKLMNTGEIAGFSSQIRCFILDDIINKKQYEKFVMTKYFPLLKLQVMNTDKVKELVDYLANKNRVDEAAALITEYQKKCGNPILPDMSPCDVLKVKLYHKSLGCSSK